jgi:TetR/AcrR family transcriptional regulator, transcriptional repressor for nem operon
VSIDQIMSGAGLTRGGFYSHFESKSDLYAEVLGCFFTDPNWKNRWEGVEMDFAAEEPGPQVVRAYLSRQHFENVENSCPMVALPTDVSRSGRAAKAAFENVFTAMVALLERSVKSRVGSSRARVVGRGAQARAIAALCVGGMVVARAMDDRRAADELRDACMAVALELGGWPAGRKVKRNGGNGNGNGHGHRGKKAVAKRALA